MKYPFVRFALSSKSMKSPKATSVTLSKTLIFIALPALLLAASPALAALNPGDKAPDFTAQASMDGHEYTFSLSEALKHGPVVLYFYPAAFTPGCTIEAHDFAEAMDDYKALHATVIGVSHDDVKTLDKFSVSECRSKFPVAADADGNIMKAYDAVMLAIPAIASRTSYVITPDNKVLYSYTDINPDKHVANTLKALKEWDFSNIKQQ